MSIVMVVGNSAPLANSPLIPEISKYTTTNLFLGYELGDIGAFDDLQLTLNVDNLFDKDPPVRFGPTGTAFTSLGRIVTLGLNTSF